MRIPFKPNERLEAAWALAGILLLALASLHPVWHSRAAKHLGDFGSHTLYLSAIAGAVFLLIRRGLARPMKAVLWWPPAACLVTFLCVEGLKRATGLPRPDGAPAGFPSGHTTLMFALA